MEHEERGHEEHHEVSEDQYDIGSDVRTLLAWKGPGRPFKKKSRQFFLSILLILFLVEVVLFLFSQYWLMLAVGALAFLAAVLNVVAPYDFHYKITTEGIKIEDHFYIWAELYDFYFKQIEASDTLIVRTHAYIPGELVIPLHMIGRDHVRKILVNFLPYREVIKKTMMEKSADWLSKTFPLERKEHI